MSPLTPVSSTQKFVFFGLYFLMYTFGLLAYTAYSELQQGIMFEFAGFFNHFLTGGLLFSTAIIAAASYISSTALTVRFSRLLILIVASTVVLTVYRSFSYFAFFARIDKIFAVFLFLLGAGLLGYVFGILYKRNMAAAQTTLAALSLLIVIGGSVLALQVPKESTADYCEDTNMACYYSLALKESNLDFCLKIPSATTYPAGPECVIQVLADLQKKNNLTTATCDGWETQEAKSICYYKLAVITHDAGMCANVIDTYSDGNMAVSKGQGIGVRKVPNKTNCLAKTK